MASILTMEASYNLLETLAKLTIYYVDLRNGSPHIELNQALYCKDLGKNQVICFQIPCKS